jgi:predicted RNase H-like nuclease (RuvC/YqgF family)
MLIPVHTLDITLDELCKQIEFVCDKYLHIIIIFGIILFIYDKILTSYTIYKPLGDKIKHLEERIEKVEKERKEQEKEKVENERKEKEIKEIKEKVEKERKEKEISAKIMREKKIKEQAQNELLLRLCDDADDRWGYH